VGEPVPKSAYLIAGSLAIALAVGYRVRHRS
jgi:hypothetical protein